MNTILVPIDFSTVSMNALVYALHFSKYIDANVKVVHITTGNLNPKYPLVLKPGQTCVEIANERIEDFISEAKRDFEVQSLQEAPDVEYENIVSLRVKSQLVELSKLPEVSYLIMGTNGNNSDHIFGSNSIHTALHANCPVMLIPRACKFKKIREIVFASDYQSANISFVEDVIELSSCFEARIHFVHVSPDPKVNMFETIAKLLNEKKLNFIYNSVHSDNVILGLHLYAVQHKIDVVTLVNRHRTFMDDILRLSTTKEMAKVNVERAMLVLHL